MQAVNIEELRQRARRRLPRAIYDFVDGGAQDERTLAANRSDFDRLVFQPRYLVDVAKRDLTTTVLGTELSMPVALAPTGLVGMTRKRGELLAARAADRAGIGTRLSCMTGVSVAEVAAVREKPFWYQLYVMRNRSLTERMLDNAKAAGCTALFVTVDTPVLGPRERDVRNGLTIPPRLRLANALDMLRRPRWLAEFGLGPPPQFADVLPLVAGGGSLTTIAKFIAEQYAPELHWGDLAWLARHWGGPLVLKGILAPDDARRAVEAGCAGVVVSNHGGRQMEGVASAIAALPAVVDAVAGQAEVLLDSGIRRGNDVIKALALGAKAVLIGRAYLWGLTAGGEAGVARVIEIFRNEIDTGLALLGRPDVKSLDPSIFVGHEPGRNAPPFQAMG